MRRHLLPCRQINFERGSGLSSRNDTKRFEPWDVPSEGRGLRYLVRFVNRAYTKLVEAELRKHVDITYAQWSFIRVLCDEDGLSQRELSERNGLMENTTFVALNIMQMRGWVRRQRDTSDKRRWLIYLTVEGRALGRLHPLVEKTARIAVENVPPETITFVRQGLRQMLGNLETALEQRVHGAVENAKPMMRPKATRRQAKPKGVRKSKRSAVYPLEAR
jgi:MarR family transcriptional regulator, organic hydroperoxide resistance regulator